MIRCYAVDDERLPLLSLLRMLSASGRAEVVGSSEDPAAAIAEVRQLQPDVLFLDIHMPEMNGFDVLASLRKQPCVVFTTAYDQYAIRAFEVNSVDYLLKPVGEERLERALDRIEARLGQPDADAWAVAARVIEALRTPRWLRRVPIRSGEKIVLIDIDEITHFRAEDRYAWACTERERFILSGSLADIEPKLDPERFLRVHRGAIVNLAWVKQLDRWFTGRLLLRLGDARGTELPVSRDRVQTLKQALGL